MQRVELDYGDSLISVDLPDHTSVVRYAETYTDPPAVDPKTATRAALDNPIDLPPLRDAAGPDKKIVIGFPDRVKGGSGPDSHRKVSGVSPTLSQIIPDGLSHIGRSVNFIANRNQDVFRESVTRWGTLHKVSIPIILEELLVGGAQMENITLLCSVGLHRKNTLEEWNQYLGPDIVNLFYPDRLLNHDAEGEIIDLGRDEMGNVVQFSSLMAEADIHIVIGHCAGNPYGGFSGGYKMVVTGHTTAASIASHHTPGTMHRDDWMGAGTKSHMRHQFRSIGRANEKKTGKPIFACGMGYAAARTYEDGMKIAEGYTGKNPRILCTPECFSGGVAVHLSVGD